MQRLVSLWCFLWLVAAAAIGMEAAHPGVAHAADDPFRVEAFGTRIAPGGAGRIEVTLVVPPGHHVYRDAMVVTVLSAGGLDLGEPSFPKGFDKPDPANPAQSREMYDLNVIVDVPVKAPAAVGEHEVQLEFGYQGCKAGLCFMPASRVVDVTVKIEEGAPAAPETGAVLRPAGHALVSAGGAAAAHAVPAVDFSGLPASADVQATDHEGKDHPVRARLLVDRDALRAGDTFRLGVHLTQRAGWHTYWRSPGDIGLPTKIDWTVPAGATTTPFAYPVPERFDQSGIVSYGYDDQVLFFTEVALPAGLAPGDYTLAARADWLVCEIMCIPGGADLALPVTVSAGDAPAAGPGAFAPLFDHFAGRHPTAPTAVDAIGVEMALSASAVRPEEGFKAAFLLNSTSGEPLLHETTAGAWPAFAPIVDGSFMVMDTKVVPVDGGGLLVVLEGETFAMDPLPEGEQVGGLFQLVVGGARVATELTLPLPWTAAGADVTPSASPLWKLADGASSAEAVASVVAPPPEGADVPAAAPVSGVPDPSDPLAFASMLGLAFIGGAILNIMPCVLPVLTIKLFSLVEQAGISAGEQRRAGLAYTAGIVVSFVLLAVAVILAKSMFGMSVGWGFQFQYPAYVAALAVIVFVFGLSLFGVFEVPTPGANQASEASNKEGLAGYFLTGVFTTLLATPCSAPFLGTGMGFAFGLPAWGIVLFFAIAALGLASPFLVIAFVPAMMRFLPRPGAWMETFKHVMGFTLMATTVWLLDVLGAQVGLDRLVHFVGFLVAVGVGAWVFGRWGGPTEPTGKQAGAFVVGTVAAGAFGWWFVDLSFAEPDCDPAGGAAVAVADLDYGEGIPWQPFTEARVASLSGQSTVFIDFTADWCLTCKVNEQTVLDTQTVKSTLVAEGIVPLKADWTRRDETITRWLQRFGKAGVPFYLVVPADPSRAPIPLPEVITPETVAEALRRANG